MHIWYDVWIWMCSLLEFKIYYNPLYSHLTQVFHNLQFNHKYNELLTRILYLILNCKYLLLNTLLCIHYLRFYRSSLFMFREIFRFWIYLFSIYFFANLINVIILYGNMLNINQLFKMRRGFLRDQEPLYLLLKTLLFKKYEHS